MNLKFVCKISSPFSILAGKPNHTINLFNVGNYFIIAVSEQMMCTLK